MVASSVASAAVVYDKDGTQMNIGGRVEAMWKSSHNSSAHSDSTIRDRIRLNVSGRTKLTEGISGYGFWESQSQHNGSSAEETGFALRQAYVGADFGKYGALQAGRWEDWVKFASDVVDHLEDEGCNAQVGRTRNSGKIGYMWSGYGVDVKLSYQTAVNNYSGLVTDLLGSKYTFDVDSGFTVAAGYTSPKVLFGPISVRAAYQHIKAQDADDSGTILGISDNDLTVNGYVDKSDLFAAGLSWGQWGNGPYIGTVYTHAKIEFENGNVVLDDTTYHADMDIKLNAFEVLAGYGFGNGVNLRAAYAYRKVETDASVSNSAAYASAKETGKRKLVTVAASYDINKNFRVWGEAHFDCNSDDGYGKFTKGDGKGANAYMIGARYSF